MTSRNLILPCRLTWLVRAGVLLSALVAMQCAWLPSQRALRQCRFEPVGYRFAGVNQQGILGHLEIAATNPGKSTAKLHRMHLWVLHTSDTLAQIQLDTVMALPAGAKVQLPLGMLIPFQALPRLAGPLAKGASLECQVVGDAWLDTPFGTYTVKNALKKTLVVDLGQASAALYQNLGIPWLKSWIP
jgi:hypothetical protein